MANDKIKTAVVAKNKTIELDGESYGPGSTVKLPESEIASLRARGFLVGPGGTAPAAAGPSVSAGAGGDGADDAAGAGAGAGAGDGTTAQ